MAPTEATREGAIMLLDMCAFDLSDRRLMLMHDLAEDGCIEGADGAATGAVLALALAARRVAANSSAVRNHARMSTDAEWYRITCGEAASYLRCGGLSGLR